MNRHTATGNDEANSQPQHSLLEEIAQLGDRERVLIGENDQLRAQLVEMKEQEKKKYDDLMVQYNMKQEYEDDGLDKQGTSNNQVTVKTEWDDQEVKVEIKEEIKEEDGCDQCLVKKELNTPDMIEIKEEVEDGEETRIIDMETLTEDRQVKRDADTNAHNVTVNIKTEPMECDFEVDKEEIKEEDEEEGNDIFIKTESSDEEVKEEIKEEIKKEYEDDHEDDCDGCERCLVKKEEVSDDDEVDNEGGLIRGGDNDEVDDERYEVTQPNVDCGQLLSNPSRDRKNDSNANESIEEGGTNLSSQQLLDTLNEPNEVTTVTQSADLLSPSTSTAQEDNPTVLNQQATASTGRNSTKRKQPTSKRSAKRSKKTLQKDDGEDGEDIANEDREESKVKMLHLNCTQSNCNVKLDSLDHLHDHLSTEHRLSPFQCYAINCNARFDNGIQIRAHIQQHHPSDTRFMCAVCPKEFDSQHNAYKHWHQNHQTGQFECNLASDCAQVTDTRSKMRTHQQTKHEHQSKHFHCTHPGCASSFSCNGHLKQHESIHLNIQPFHCNFPHCSHRTNRRANLVTHIRMKHFGLPKSMKEQMVKNIVDLRDPNEYVRVVVED